MTRTSSMLAALVLAFTSLSDATWADEGAKAAKSPPASTVAQSLKPTPDAVTRHEIDLGGKHIAYTATVGGILAAANNGQ